MRFLKKTNKHKTEFSDGKSTAGTVFIDWIEISAILKDWEALKYTKIERWKNNGDTFNEYGWIYATINI